MRAQSSNSGHALTIRPSRQATLNRTAPSGVSTVDDLALEALALDLAVPQPDRRRLAEDRRPAAPRRSSGGATTVSSVPGRFFFICTGT